MCLAEAKTRNHLGFSHASIGHHTEALHHQRLALRHYREAGDDRGLA